MRKCRGDTWSRQDKVKQSFASNAGMFTWKPLRLFSFSSTMFLVFREYHLLVYGVFIKKLMRSYCVHGTILGTEVERINMGQSSFARWMFTGTIRVSAPKGKWRWFERGLCAHRDFYLMQATRWRSGGVACTNWSQDQNPDRDEETALGRRSAQTSFPAWGDNIMSNSKSEFCPESLRTISAWLTGISFGRSGLGRLLRTKATPHRHNSDFYHLLPLK